MDLEYIFQDIIVQRYEKNRIRENNLAYHNWEHTHNVLIRALKLEEVLTGGAYLHEKDFALIKYAALGHDIVQDFAWEEAPNKIGKIRVKKTWQNEEKSAEETIKIIKEYTSLTLEEEKLIRDAILITIPAWDEELQTTYQPNLRTVPSYISLCIALADLGYIGMVSEDNFVEIGNSLFKEQRLLPDIKVLTPEQKNLLGQELNAWNVREVHFYEGRKIRFQKEIERVSNISWKVIAEINGLFSNFDKNIEIEKQYCAKCEKMSFNKLVKTFGIK
jgi:hypothetical protein